MIKIKRVINCSANLIFKFLNLPTSLLYCIVFTPTHTHTCACAHTHTTHWYNEKQMTDQSAEEKRWVFSFDLKEESEDECLTERGREF